MGIEEWVNSKIYFMSVRLLIYGKNIDNLRLNNSNSAYPNKMRTRMNYLTCYLFV